MTQTHESFATQALHYFNREHEAVRREPIAGPAAWRGPELAARRDWLVELTPAQLEELEAACAAVEETGFALGQVGREQFPLPTLGAVARGWGEELMHGRGVVVLRGFPVARWGDERSALAYWGLGQHIGRPGAQNPQGELLGHVVDTGEDATNPFIRRYRTAGDIAYHCDLADAVGLLCLRTAKLGGQSRIVSSVAVYNTLLQRRPELIDRLYEPFLLDTRDEQRDGQMPYVPVFACRYARGQLRTFYHSDYFRSVTRHAEVAPFTPQEQELMDAYEEIANSPELYFDMSLAVGDIQLISNHFVLHARTAYEDWPEPERKRHLLRLWLSL